MKKFVEMILLFGAPLIFFAVVPTLVEWQVFRKAVRHPQAHIGIIGDSHAACGVSPEFFPELANFAQRASQPMVWRAKLGVVLDENPQIDTFVIELWTGVLTRDAEKCSKDRAHFVRNHIPANVLLDIFRTNEMGGLPDDNLGRNYILGVLLPFLKRCCTWSTVSTLQDNYYRLDRQLADSQWYKNGAVMEPDSWGHAPAYSETPVRAEIEDILRELTRRKIKPILLTMPFWAPARNQLHTKADQEWFANEMKDLCRKYSCKWYDMSDAVPEVENWADNSHLNALGAERYTKLLNEQLVHDVSL